MRVAEGTLDDIDFDGILPLAKSNSAISHWSKWSLPGHGKAYDDCGTFGYLGCLDTVAHAIKRADGVDYTGKIYIKKYKRNCARSECPVDFETWASKEAHRATRRLTAFGKTLKGGRNSPIHVIVSVPQEDMETLPYDKLRVRAQKQAQKAGLWGGLVIVHPFRENDEGCWYLSPHFHMLGYGWISNAAKVYQETGWIVKNLGVRKSVYATIQYQLSHAGVYMKAEREKSKKATITWFGCLSYSKFHYEDDTPPAHVCPICEQKLRVVQWKGVGDPPLLTIEGFQDTGEYIIDGGLFQWEELMENWSK